MRTGAWFHISHQYGDSLAILRQAFDQSRAEVPKLMAKIGWSSVPEITGQVQLHLDALQVNHLDAGQLCLGGQVIEDLVHGGPAVAGLRDLQQRGMVRRYILEVFPWTSAAALRILRAPHHRGLITGVIFYFNPLQRFVNNELWDLLVAGGIPVIALRSVGGGSVHRLRDVPGAAWKDYLRQRAVQVAPIFERSGIASWSEFCLRFALGMAQSGTHRLAIEATVGSTANPENLKQLVLAATPPVQQLDPAIVSEVLALQRVWADTVDAHAEPWSM